MPNNPHHYPAEEILMVDICPVDSPSFTVHREHTQGIHMRQRNMTDKVTKEQWVELEIYWSSKREPLPKET